jgi:2-(1,2-epoxy-1,2-dihydrophenyl)acetyl-CoA isomerase
MARGQGRKTGVMSLAADDAAALSRLRRGSLSAGELTAAGLAQIAPAIATFFVLGGIVGASGLAAPLVILIAGIGFAFHVNSNAEFSRAIPSAGFYVTYLSRAFGRRVGAMGAFVYTLSYITLGAAIFYQVGVWTHTSVQAMFGVNLPWWIPTLVVEAAVALMIIGGVRLSIRVAVSLFGFEMAVMVAGAVAMLVAHPAAASAAAFNPAHLTNGLSGLGLGFPLAIFLFLGASTPALMAEESRSPRRSVPLAIFGATAAAVAYGLTVGRRSRRRRGPGRPGGLPRHDGSRVRVGGSPGHYRGGAALLQDRLMKARAGIGGRHSVAVSGHERASDGYLAAAASDPAAADDGPVVCYRREGGVATITLNRPHRLNAVNPALVEGLCCALDEATADGVGAVVLTGAGRSFCSGHDLKEDGGDLGEAEQRRRLQRIQDVTRKVRQAPYPVIAAVRGYALGGCEFALCCDLVLAARDAVFGFPEVEVGLGITGGISHVLPTAVGLAKAKELVLLGRRFDAGEAARLGLVNEVTGPEDLAARAGEWARTLAARPRRALALAKNALDRGAQAGIDAAYETEVANSLALRGNTDAEAAAAAFRRRSGGRGGSR